MKQFELGAPFASVIGYLKAINDRLDSVYANYVDNTGLGAYIVEDMQRGGIKNVVGINFTVDSKEQIATALKESIRTAFCSQCGWMGYIDTVEGEWRTTCPKQCRTKEGNPANLRPQLHIPFDPELFHELNIERYELAKTGKILFLHPEGTHDDRFWVVALAVCAAEQAQLSKALIRVI